jgi:hypothetical protein
MRALTFAIAIALTTAAAAFAAQPPTPSRWAGGDGHGTPVMFKLNKHGKATSAAVAYTCKGANGIGLAQSKKGKIKGHVKSDGTLVIRYRYKDSDQNGKLRVRFDVTFPTANEAKGTVSIKNKGCGNQHTTFTAQPVQGS